MKHHLFSRFTSVLLAVVLLAGLMGTPILATDNVLGAEPAATVEEQTVGSADESDVGVDSAEDDQAEATTTDEEESASSDSSTDTETSGEEVVAGEETDSTVPAGDESDSTVISEEESTDSAEGTEPADETEPTEEAVVELTASVEDENGTTVANVTVEAAEGVIPEGAKLVAELLTGAAEEEAANELDEAGVEYDGYMALDIHLENADGEEVEPNGEVRVVMVAPAALPEEADPTTVAVQHHEELDNGEVKVEQVASAADAAQPAPVALFAANSVSEAEQGTASITADNGDVTATFDVEGFSKFTITWNIYNSDWYNPEENVEFEIRDMQGNLLTIPGVDSVNLNIKEDNTLYYFEDVVRAQNIFEFTDASGQKYVFQRAVCVDPGGEMHPLKAFQRTKAPTRHILTFYDSVYEGDKGVYTVGNLTGDADNTFRLLYRKAEEKDPDAPVTEVELQNTKQTIKNDDGTYDLELTVSGAVGSITEKAKVDIVFVVDSSNSMNDAMDGDSPSSSEPSRTKVVGDAVTSLVDSLESNPLLDVQYSMVHFGTGLSTGTNYYNDAIKTVGWTTDAASIKNAAYETERGKGGTNYQAGLVETRSLLLDTRSDALRYVIFLSDGEPTAYYDNGVSEDGRYVDQIDKDSAYSEADKLGNLNGFFAVGVGKEGADSAKDVLNTLCDRARVASNGQPENFKMYPASDVTGLNDAFNTIQANITQLLCDHVAVTDTLSDYVQPVEEAAPNLVVTDKSGAPVKVDPSKVWVNYEGTTKTLKINFAPDYKLEAGYTYKASLTIETTEKAYQEYAAAANVYPNTGDANTGTHAGQSGFYSNDEAKITYTYNGIDQTNYFPKPVVQVEPQTLIIEKTVDGLEGDALRSLGSRLTFTVTVNGSKKTYRLDGFTVTQQTANKVTKYRLEIPGLMPGASYTVTETDYDMPLYEEELTPAVGSRTGIITRNTDNIASFVNKYTPSVGDLKITKCLKNDEGAEVAATEDATFVFKIVGAEKTYYASVKVAKGQKHGEATVQGLPTGQYTVTEVLVPSGYLQGDSNPTNGQVTVSDSIANISFSNTVIDDTDITKDDGMVINRFTCDTNGNWTWAKQS